MIVENKIKDIIIKTVLSVEGLMFSSAQMHVPYKNNCFDLLGFDILIDDNLDAWLLEVNLSPSLNCDSPLDQKIKGEMLADLFTMIGIVPIDMRKIASSGNKNKEFNFAAYMQQIAPLASRKKKHYSDGGKPRTADQDSMTSEERAAVKETEEELKRCGSFDRIFPSEISINYRNFFEEERKLNTLVCNHLGKLHRKGQFIYRRAAKPV
mmetsp:Transcript_28588/g.50840  ORF Transcript_28588/g.50840 Transcript_28588/m.50840 type:complete len:209 (+) Transcript_28588:1077-1703(+)